MIKAGKTQNLITRVIKGHKITLAAGARYYAVRRAPNPPGIHGDVVIRRYDPRTREPGQYPPLAQTLPSMPRERANDFMDAFNDGNRIFIGRVW